ncbi:MAG: isochorismatase family protein [Coriobacteriia bacterium]|nr:isochorismatase family protein [Coriobacteriia bacterium]MDO9108246.1 isochorismatase family protein [Coriobacteriia bacterium]
MFTPRETLIARDDLVLVIIDVQDKLAAAMPHSDRVIAAVNRLARTTALVGAPLILTRQYPQGLGPTVPQVEDTLLELAQQGARVSSVDKMAFCCASDESFCEALSATGRRQVVLVGMETHICVAQTALALSGTGFQVQVAADACCSRDDDIHEFALQRMGHGGIIVTTSESVMYEAVARAGTDEFKSLLRIVKE